MEVPAKLTERRNWILWRDEAGRKIPYQPNGRAAKSNDPTTWVDYGTAIARKAGYSGIGFVFDGTGIFGIDLDGCIDGAGQVQDWAKRILDQFPTYAEVSPSGNGIKIFALGRYDGKGRKKILDLPAYCDKNPGIEIYGSGRYFTVTGQKLPGHPLKLHDCQERLDETIATHWPAPAAIAPLPPPITTPPDVVDRARKYLAVLPPAISGSGGHNQTFRAACVLVIGFALDSDQAYSLLAEWNETCQPPWSEKELRHKLDNAAKEPGPRGELLSGHEDPSVNLGPLLASLTTPPAVTITTIPEAEPPDDIPEDPQALPLSPGAIPGLIGEVVRHNLTTALYPQPELALGAAIALMATITGRKAADPSGTRTNVYVLGLAPSGSGKEHARKLNKEILLRAGAAKMLGPERIGSSAGLARCVRDNPAILFQLDEISRLLETTKSAKSAHLWNVPSVLLQLFGSSNCLWIGDAYAKAEQTPIINQPHAVIYGTSVPGPFWDCLTHENVTEGLLGRFLPFESGYADIQAVEALEAPQTLIERVKWWITLNPAADLKTPGGNLGAENPNPLIFRYAADAADRYRQHAEDIVRRRRQEDPARGAMWSRAIGTTAKLALIFAASEGISPDAVSPTITLAHVENAIRISNWATRKMLRQVFQYVATNDRERQSKKILRMVLTPLTQNQLTRKTQYLSSREREDIVRGLIQAGLVEVVEETTKGRTRRVIRQIDALHTLTKD